MSAESAGPKPHIYEFDMLRALTAITVVAVHTLAFNSGLYASEEGRVAHYAVLDIIHWTRDIFLFITAFVLTYVYYGRPFSTGRFWIKRSIGVLLPYSIWSIAYILSSNPPHDPFVFAQVAVVDILTGNASYQLYYILLTLQLYLVLPLFLGLLQRIAQHPWRALSISFAIELVIMYVSYEYVQQGPLASTALGQSLDTILNRFLLTYQFYIILGGLAALYMERIRAFLSRHGKWAVGSFIAGLGIALASYWLEVQVYHASLDVATRVLQPAIMLYSLAVIIFLCWLGIAWVNRSGQHGLPPAYGFWHLLSDASFGIYLVHAFTLTAVMLWILPQMPNQWPACVRVLFTWMLAAGGACLISIILLKIPGLSRLVGRTAEWHWPNKAAVSERTYSNRVPRERKVEAPR